MSLKNELIKYQVISTFNNIKACVNKTIKTPITVTFKQ